MHYSWNRMCTPGPWKFLINIAYENIRKYIRYLYIIDFSNFSYELHFSRIRPLDDPSEIKLAAPDVRKIENGKNEIEDEKKTKSTQGSLSSSRVTRFLARGDWSARAVSHRGAAYALRSDSRIRAPCLYRPALLSARGLARRCTQPRVYCLARGKSALTSRLTNGPVLLSRRLRIKYGLSKKKGEKDEWRILIPPRLCNPPAFFTFLASCCLKVSSYLKLST